MSCGDCVYQWVLVSTTCTEACECPPPPDRDGDYEGETVVLDCEPLTPCCVSVNASAPGGQTVTDDGLAPVGDLVGSGSVDDNGTTYYWFVFCSPGDSNSQCFRATVWTEPFQGGVLVDEADGCKGDTVTLDVDGQFDLVLECSAS